MRFFALVLFMALFVNNSFEAKIRILTFHYNLPELIEIQHKTLKQFVRDDYELIVFNDAKDPAIELKINETCARCNLLSIRYEPDWHRAHSLNDKVFEWGTNPGITSCIRLMFTAKEKGNAKIPNYNQPSIRHCHVIDYALKNFGYNHDDLVVILDGDCFPIRPINLRSLIGDNHLCGIRKYVVENEIDYLWVVFSMFNPQTIPYKEELNFNIALINDKVHDTGSQTYHFLNDHPDVKCVKFHGESSSGFYHWNDQELSNWGFVENEIMLLRELASLKNFPWPITVEFHVMNHFIHLGNSSFGLPGQQEKINCVNRFLEKINYESTKNSYQM